MQSAVADDPYVILGIGPDVTLDELKRVYRRLSLTWHPDRHAHEPEAAQSAAERQFKRINAAYVAVGEALRARSTSTTRHGERPDAGTTRVTAPPDIQVEAIRAVVASAALRVVPNLPRHAFRRVIGVVEGLLLNTLAVGDRAFLGGFEAALREEMHFVGADASLRAEALSVLDAAADELQWHGRGADPKAWQELLRPLERARGVLLHDAAPVRSTDQAPLLCWDQILRPEPPAVLAQSMLAVLGLLLLLPIAPLSAPARLILLVLDLGALAYLTLPRRQ
jgi:hypothetical protein